MAQLAFTDVAIKNLKPPPKGQKTYWDANLANFLIRVSQGGTKTFGVMTGRSRELITIGRYPTISLADARKAAKTILAERTLNKHRPTQIRFEDALTSFLEDVESQVRPRTYSEYKRLLERHWLPPLRHSNVADITPHDVHKKLDKLKKTPQEQAHALTALKRFVSWALSRHYLDRSPVLGITKKVSPGRERVLEDDELVTIWNAATAYPFGLIVRLCILTGLRRGEVAALHWDDIEDEAIVIPPQRTKNGRAHVIPRTDVLNQALEDVKKLDDTLLFPSRVKNSEGCFNGWSKCKRALDEAIAERNDGTALDPWTLHDLRRTFSTNLAALGTPPHIVERLLNHKSGTISGVAAIYNRFDYFEECKVALEGWHGRVLQLLAR